MSQINIVIADCHEVVRRELKTLLQRQLNLCVIGEAATSEQALEMVAEHKPDIVLMDTQMSDAKGVDTCRKIIELLPETRVILLTSFAENDLLFAAVRSGAAGYVLKRIASDDLVHTIEAVAHGESRHDPALTEAKFKRISQVDNAKEGPDFADLSHQELRVLVLIADGLTNGEIAGELSLEEGAVRNSVRNILSKLHTANRADAAAFALQHSA